MLIPVWYRMCKKITPAHDPNDFDIGKRHNLDFINVMNDDASINKNVLNVYIGMDRFDARENIVKDIEKAGFIRKTEDYLHKVGYSEGNVPIEFYMWISGL